MERKDWRNLSLSMRGIGILRPVVGIGLVGGLYYAATTKNSRKLPLACTWRMALGDVALKGGRPRDAIAEYRTALRAVVDQRSGFAVHIHRRLGEALIVLSQEENSPERLSEAREVYLDALRVLIADERFGREYVGTVSLSRELGRVYELEGRIDDAVGVWEMAIDIGNGINEPELVGAIAEDIGRVCRDPLKALRYLDIAAKAGGNQMVIATMKADNLFALGMLEEAKNELDPIAALPLANDNAQLILSALYGTIMISKAMGQECDDAMRRGIWLADKIGDIQTARKLKKLAKN